MNKTAKIWLIIAACIVTIGGILFVSIMQPLGWDFSKLSINTFETNQHEITQSFDNISLKTDTADITFILSDDGICRVECYEEVKAKHSVTVENNTLNIDLVNNKAWYDYFGIYFGSPRIKVYLPEKQYAELSIRGSTGEVELPKDFTFSVVEVLLSTGDANVSSSASASMKIKTSTGNIRIRNISTGDLGLRVSTGRITVTGATCTGDISVDVATGKTYLTDVTCKNLVSEGDTGNITLNNVLVSEKIEIERSTGDVNFLSSDAAEIFVETDTGDVTGNLLSDKIFYAESDTGRINVPKSTTGGRCEIETDTGDIKLTVK